MVIYTLTVLTNSNSCFIIIGLKRDSLSTYPSLFHGGSEHRSPAVVWNVPGWGND